MAHELQPDLYVATRDIFDRAAADGISMAINDGVNVDEEFINALRHNNEVFSAFRTHKMQNDIAAQLLTEDGELKSFRQFVKDTAPYVDHKNRLWLQTEYNTAVLRAHQAANWQQFHSEKDVFPNLRWVPSTSPNPGEDHRVFWDTVRPVDDPFWDAHRPGDRWNCKCDLEQTDEPVTPVPDSTPKDNPAPGLENNPAKDKQLFSQKHPYYPKNCSSCGFAKNKLAALFHNLASDKNCTACRFVCDAIPDKDKHPTLKTLKTFSNGGSLNEYDTVERNKSDYKAIKRIGRLFAEMGESVSILPRVHRKSNFYDEIFGELIGTKYENKCPDLKVGKLFYEYEGFEKPWNKKKVGRMLSHGCEQSARIVINNTKGCSDRFIRKQIIARQKQGKIIDEVWLYEKGELRLFLKDNSFIKQQRN